ncbi:MAG: hypothetical protein R2856_00485 [Caldilineaceae bacterium]
MAQLIVPSGGSSIMPQAFGDLIYTLSDTQQAILNSHGYAISWAWWCRTTST